MIGRTNAQFGEKRITSSYALLRDGSRIKFENASTPISNFYVAGSGNTITIGGIEVQKSNLKEIHFRDDYLNVLSIGSNFLYDTSIDTVGLSGLANVKTIDNNFLSSSPYLQVLDLSVFTKLVSWAPNSMISGVPLLNKIYIGSLNVSSFNSMSYAFSDNPNNSNCVIYARTTQLGNTFKSKFSNLNKWTVVEY